ncbi:MAG: histidine phosphotransferase family protein [Bdellovibrionales bacterium]
MENLQVDIRILELLSSRMCHDLVSPVGAINNGVELIEEVGGNTTGDALQLIAKSAVQAARRLRCFRLAYGRAGSESGLSVNDVRQVAEHYLEGGKSKLVWPATTPISAYAEHRGALKLLLNICIIAEEILAYGGIIQVEGEAGSPKVTISITGRGAHVPDHLTAAIANSLDIDEITSKTVHSYITARLAEYYGFRIAAEAAGEDAVTITLVRT